ncbi:MAG TPA: CPBP family intramembrane glutamic endopeptidase [Pyrinomonadaceae bacterium]|nr:CPBP family intramembrane glutamic endopeptidase [Pyrinomonadaceae bacterium]
MTPDSSIYRFATTPFFNLAGRLRSGWRLGIFVVLYVILLTVLLGGIFVLLFPSSANSTEAATSALESRLGFVAQAFALFTAAALIGWACGRVLEGLPWRALGWALHRGWWRDLGVGSLVGAVSLVVGALIAMAFGGFAFSFKAAEFLPAALNTLLVSGIIFVLAAAAEEVLFRGYPLQTVLRSWPAWLAIVPSSIMFAFVHLGNPNVARGFTFVNTMLAGVWLAVAYLRTRSLWFPLGVHWSWNWTMGALLGLPVSGITQIAPDPLLRATDNGPAWLTGGSYGIEGGAACTVALLLSTIFIWRTRLIAATEDLKKYTDGENPAPVSPPLTLFEEPAHNIQPPASDGSLKADN